MADILIKGMEMPTCCADCDIHNPFTDPPYCRRLLKAIPIKGRLENCPLVEVKAYQAVNEQTGETKVCYAEVER